jgi:hypothetical protein
MNLQVTALLPRSFLPFFFTLGSIQPNRALYTAPSPLCFVADWPDLSSLLPLLPAPLLAFLPFPALLADRAAAGAQYALHWVALCQILHLR